MQDRDDSHLLDELAGRFGIDADYYDIFGTKHVISHATKQAILAAMGVSTQTKDDRERELAHQEEYVWQHPCPPVLVHREGVEGAWSFCMPAKEHDASTISIEWMVRDEAGRHLFSEKIGPRLQPVEQRQLDGQTYWKFHLPVPAHLAIGYYDVSVSGGSSTYQVVGSLRLIIVPLRCYQPAEIEIGKRLWGLSLQLYQLRSPQNWGVGDFGDLYRWIESAATNWEADIIGLNPLHALKNTRPYHISPYSPDSRFALNLLYIDVQQIPEFQESAEAQRTVSEEDFHRCLEALRASDRVDYERVAMTKLQVLKRLFSTFESQHYRHEGDRILPSTKRAGNFERYLHEEGERLESFALFQVLSEMFAQQAPPLFVWQDWPEGYRHSSSMACQEFLASHRHDVRFHQYVQWVAHEQLHRVYERTRELGMSIGLYHDLALGSDREGSDAWLYRSVMALGADCGCPPDAFAPEGQNWGLPPINPHALRQTGYKMFIDLLQKNLAHAGALRLDHVMALFRLFWIPRGMSPSAGAYVQYPWEDLLGILALESVRHRAVIVGEDLGTVPDYVREKLEAAGVLSYRVFYFERGHDGEWKPPEQYPRQGLAVAATHDLPTLAGFWIGEDLAVRRRLGLYQDDTDYRRAQEERRRDKIAILRALERAGLWFRGAEGEILSQSLGHELTEAIYSFVARTPSLLMLITLEDLIGDPTQVNLPGTLDTYPNWSHKTPLTLQQVMDHSAADRLTRLLRSLRP